MATTAQLTENSHQGFEPEKPDCTGFEHKLSRNMRWGCGHVYDETPADIAVYVRNDPVNYVDPDGRLVKAPPGFSGSPFWLWDLPSPEPPSNGNADPVDGGPRSGGGLPSNPFTDCLTEFGDAAAKANLTEWKFDEAAEAAKRTSGSLAVLLSLWANETRFSDDTDIRSSVGAIGPVQLMPDTLKKEPGVVLKGEDPYNDTIDNLAAGSRYYSRLTAHYKVPENQAAAAYNAGPYAYKNSSDAQGYQKRFDAHLESYKKLTDCITARSK